MPFQVSECLYESAKNINIENREYFKEICEKFNLNMEYLEPSNPGGTQHPEICRILFTFKDESYKILMVQRENIDRQGWSFDAEVAWGFFEKDIELPKKHWFEFESSCLLSASFDINGDAGLHGLPLYTTDDYKLVEPFSGSTSNSKIFGPPKIHNNKKTERMSIIIDEKVVCPPIFKKSSIDIDDTSNDVSETHYNLFRKFVTETFLAELANSGVQIQYFEF